MSRLKTLTQRPDNNLKREIVYHADRAFIWDMGFLASIIAIGTVTAIVGLIMILHTLTPDL